VSLTSLVSSQNLSNLKGGGSLVLLLPFERKFTKLQQFLLFIKKLYSDNWNCAIKRHSCNCGVGSKSFFFWKEKNLQCKYTKFTSSFCRFVQIYAAVGCSFISVKTSSFYSSLSDGSQATKARARPPSHHGFPTFRAHAATLRIHPTRVLLIQAVRTIFKGSDVFDAPDDRVTAAAALADLTLSVA